MREMAAEKLEDMVPLPVDVNGEVIHIGDEMVTSMGVRNVVDYIDIRLREKDTYHYIFFKDSRYRHDPRELRHYHKPTVEDVLREFADRAIRIAAKDGINTSRISFYTDEDALFEYAAKLQLKEEE